MIFSDAAATPFFYRILKFISYGLLLVCAVWMVGLIIYQPICALPIIPFALVLMAVIHRNFRDKLRNYPIPFYRSPSLILWILLLTEFIAYLLVGGPTGTPWQSLWAKSPVIRCSGDTVHISNLRDFHYVSAKDYDVRYLAEDFDLNSLSSVDLALVETQKSHKLLAMLSFGFEDGRYLVFSPETRIPSGNAADLPYLLYKGLGRTDVLSTEEDCLARHSEFGDTLILLPLKATAEQRKALLRSCLNHTVALNADNKVELPLPESLVSGLNALLESIYPELGGILPVRYSHLPRKLMECGALQTQDGESLEMLLSRCTLSEPVAPAEERAYSATLRRKLDMAVPDTVPERQVQEQILAPRRAERAAKAKGRSSDMQSHFASSDDVPEPGDRLSNEGRRDAIPQLDRELPPPDVDQTDVGVALHENEHKDDGPKAAETTTAETSSTTKTAEQAAAEREADVLTMHQQELAGQINPQSTAKNATQAPKPAQEQTQNEPDDANVKVDKKKPDWVAPRKKINPLDRKQEPKQEDTNPFGDKPLSL